MPATRTSTSAQKLRKTLANRRPAKPSRGPAAGAAVQPAEFDTSLIDSLPTAVALLDSQLRIRRVNRTFQLMFGLAADPALQQQQPFGDLVRCTDAPRLLRLLTQVVKGGAPLLRHEVECVLAGGHPSRILLNATHIPPPRRGRAIAGLAVTLVDVGSIRHVQEVESSLKQKETLLKEIHHRVKNNLQVISSLLALQAHGINDPMSLRRLKDSQERIRSMALIHEKLYKSRDLTRIDMRDYIQSLAASLAHIYGAASGTVTVSVLVDDVHLDIDTAIPCGLLLNELLSNVYKYAFPDKRRGHVSIGLAVDGAGYLVLTVQDNGVGLPAAVDVQSSQTLGLLIVRSLTEQLRGMLDYSGTNGTVFTVRFPEEAEKSPA